MVDGSEHATSEVIEPGSASPCVPRDCGIQTRWTSHQNVSWRFTTQAHRVTVPRRTSRFAQQDQVWLWHGATNALVSADQGEGRPVGWRQRLTAPSQLFPLPDMADRHEPPTPTASEPEHQNNQFGDASAESHLHAFGAAPNPDGDQGTVQGGGRAPTTPTAEPHFALLTPRDIALLRAVVCLRVLTYEQIQRVVFPAVDPSIVRRRIRRLAHAGWLTTWEPRSRAGGHTRYAHPTAATIRAVLPMLRPEAPWAALVDRMVPRSERRPLKLGDTPPKWLAHQREVNHLVTRIMTCPERRILWASSWDCPFPSRLGIVSMPQPDYVFVEEVHGVTQLVFGEHDRGTEPLDRFIARKIGLYSSLADYPDLCAQHFGIATFRVDVSVIDVARSAPSARLRSLLNAAELSARPDLFRFTLGGWLYAFPHEAVWFRPVHASRPESVA